MSWDLRVSLNRIHSCLFLWHLRQLLSAWRNLLITLMWMIDSVRNLRYFINFLALSFNSSHSCDFLRLLQAGSVEGQVVEMGLMTTSLLSAEKFPIIVPNSLFSSQVGMLSYTLMLLLFWLFCNSPCGLSLPCHLKSYCLSLLMALEQVPTCVPAKLRGSSIYYNVHRSQFLSSN